MMRIRRVFWRLRKVFVCDKNVCSKGDDIGGTRQLQPRGSRAFNSSHFSKSI